jgi:hypothetical protein
MSALVSVLQRDSKPFSEVLGRNDIRLATLKPLGGKRYKKKIDLVLERTDETERRIVAIEAKACMTAHGKAHTRLISELTSSINAVKDYDSSAAFFGVVVVNFSATFTSPLNLPGPNEHDPLDGPKLIQTVEDGLSSWGDEIAGILYMPISLDNESYCHPPTKDDQPYRDKEARFRAGIYSALGT